MTFFRSSIVSGLILALAAFFGMFKEPQRRCYLGARLLQIERPVEESKRCPVLFLVWAFAISVASSSEASQTGVALTKAGWKMYRQVDMHET